MPEGLKAAKLREIEELKAENAKLKEEAQRRGLLLAEVADEVLQEVEKEEKRRGKDS